MSIGMFIERLSFYEKFHSTNLHSVLIFSSFTPFIVTFLHAVASHSPQDLQILEDVVHTLKGVREASKASKRLYQICSTFAELAKEFSQTRNSSIGIYNHQSDSLQLADGSEQPSVQSDLFQEALDVNLTDYLSPSGGL